MEGSRHTLDSPEAGERSDLDRPKNPADTTDDEQAGRFSRLAMEFRREDGGLLSLRVQHLMGRKNSGCVSARYRDELHEEVTDLVHHAALPKLYETPFLPSKDHGVEWSQKGKEVALPFMPTSRRAYRQAFPSLKWRGHPM